MTLAYLDDMKINSQASQSLTNVFHFEDLVGKTVKVTDIDRVRTQMIEMISTI